MSIHPQAIVDPQARIADDVEIGPWTLIGPDVEIGSGTKIHSHVVVKGPTRIGKDNVIFQFASVGEDCQDKKYRGEPTELLVGDRNVIREGCTIHRGTIQDEGITRIGSDNLFMAYVHVAHDCQVGNQCILANQSTLAGHVVMDDWAILGGGTMVHQFCKIGQHSMSAGGSIVLRDIPAFVMAGGQPAGPFGLNAEGLKRRGFSAESLKLLKSAYKTIYRQGLTVEQALEELEPRITEDEHIAALVTSLRRSDRGIIR